MDASVPDLLRLLAVPAFGWAARRDLRTRRVPGEVWYPLVALGVALLAWDAWLAYGGLSYYWRLFLVRTTVSLGVVAPVAYVFWRTGGFGGADAKAFLTLAVLFPTYPSYLVAGMEFPLVETALGVFSLTVLTNTVLLGAGYPLVYGARNLRAGRVRPRALVGVPVDWRDVPATHGRLLETPTGFTRGGLDLDALRMYLRWRDVTLADLRADPALRDPGTLPESPGDPTDGAVADGGRVAAADSDDTTDPGGPDHPADLDDPDDRDDPWGAAAFLDDVDHGAYGTTPDQLREGLDLLASREEVWVSPGIPFIVPTFAGLVAALAYGDLLFGALQALGAA